MQLFDNLLFGQYSINSLNIANNVESKDEWCELTKNRNFFFYTIASSTLCVRCDTINYTVK